MAAWAGPATRDLSGSGPPEEVLGQSVTANLLALLGTPPLLGRTFRPEEEHEDSLVVVLSYRLWQRRFGGDPHIAGRTILMNGAHYTVDGVMPPGFQFPDRTKLESTASGNWLQRFLCRCDWQASRWWPRWFRRGARPA